MTMFFGYKRLVTLDDWRGIAGAKNWRQKRSAFELAHAWHAAQSLPTSIQTALNTSGHEELKGVTVQLCLAEKPVFLDTRHAPSMTDVMAYGQNMKGNSVLIGVEAKADEVFASRVSTWVRGDVKPADEAVPPRPSRVQRLKFLGRHLSREISPDSDLRYQLLHRTVSVVLEAQLHSAVAAIVVVQAFGPQADENVADFERFLGWLGCSVPAKGRVTGPCLLGETTDLPIHFLYCQDPFAEMK